MPLTSETEGLRVQRQGSGSESTRAAGSTFGPSLLTRRAPPPA
ncbi:hypothetical protein WME91_06210 [Sorangium sp. So ce269]